jgi:hypothetical protein
MQSLIQIWNHSSNLVAHSSLVLRLRQGKWAAYFSLQPVCQRQRSHYCDLRSRRPLTLLLHLHQSTWCGRKCPIWIGRVEIPTPLPLRCSHRRPRPPRPPPLLLHPLRYHYWSHQTLPLLHHHGSSQCCGRMVGGDCWMPQRTLFLPPRRRLLILPHPQRPLHWSLVTKYSLRDRNCLLRRTNLQVGTAFWIWLSTETFSFGCRVQVMVIQQSRSSSTALVGAQTLG